MTDDPRDILKAAGVECAEVGVAEESAGELERDLSMMTPFHQQVCRQVLRDTDVAVLALARLVAQYKWLAEHDIQLVPKDDWHTPGETDQSGGFAIERRTGFVLTRLQRRWRESHEEPDA